MKNLRNLINLTGLITIGFLILLSTESMGQVKKMSPKDMTEASTSVLYGKCKKIKCEWNENMSIIYTYVTIQPEEYIKGNLGSEVTIAVPGGRVDDILYEVSEMPFFTEEEDIVAFIWTSPKGKNLITGGFQGKIKIDKDSKTGKRSVVVEDPDDENESTDQVPGQLKKAQRMQLEDFVVKLKGYIK